VTGPRPGPGSPGRRSARPRKRPRAAVILVLLALLAIAGIPAIAASSHHSGPSARRPASQVPQPRAGQRSPSQGAVAAAAATRSQAAEWVSRQVSRSAIAACDPAMCAALQAAGVQAADLQMLSASAADPLGADIVVATPALQSQFGGRLGTVYAPAVLARFGSGAAQIEVRVVAAGGAAAYTVALGQDVQARKGAAAQLLGNSKIKLQAAGRAELTAGQVDSRLLLMLATLASVHPVQVLAFTDAGPGADTSMPLRSAELASADHPAGMSESSYVDWLRGVLRGQRPPYDSQISVAGAQGQPVVDVQFAAPSPLGLLKGG